MGQIGRCRLTVAQVLVSVVTTGVEVVDRIRRIRRTVAGDRVSLCVRANLRDHDVGGCRLDHPLDQMKRRVLLGPVKILTKVEAGGAVVVVVVMSSGPIQYGITWSSVIQYRITQSGVIQYGISWSSVARSGMVDRGMVRDDLCSMVDRTLDPWGHQIRRAMIRPGQDQVGRCFTWNGQIARPAQ